MGISSCGNSYILETRDTHFSGTKVQAEQVARVSLALCHSRERKRYNRILISQMQVKQHDTFVLYGSENGSLKTFRTSRRQRAV